MSEEIHNCQNIDDKPASFFFQEGKGRGRQLLILGESLGKNNCLESGKAFYTTEDKVVPTGKKLNEELKLLKLCFEECAFTEIAKCYLANNRKILKTCGLKSGKQLISQIKAYNIKIIFSLGVITKDILEELFEVNLPMGEINQVGVGDRKIAVLPLYHPSPASPRGHRRNLEILERVGGKIEELMK